MRQIPEVQVRSFTQDSVTVEFNKKCVSFPLEPGAEGFYSARGEVLCCSEKGNDMDNPSDGWGFFLSPFASQVEWQYGDYDEATGLQVQVLSAEEARKLMVLVLRFLARGGMQEYLSDLYYNNFNPDHETREISEPNVRHFANFLRDGGGLVNINWYHAPRVAEEV